MSDLTPSCNFKFVIICKFRKRKKWQHDIHHNEAKYINTEHNYGKSVTSLIATFSIKATLLRDSIETVNVASLSTMTLTTIGVISTLSINDTQQKDTKLKEFD